MDYRKLLNDPAVRAGATNYSFVEREDYIITLYWKHDFLDNYLVFKDGKWQDGYGPVDPLYAISDARKIRELETEMEGLKVIIRKL